LAIAQPQFNRVIQHDLDEGPVGHPHRRACTLSCASTLSVSFARVPGLPFQHGLTTNDVSEAAVGR
jgi:hypothetical protein